MVCSRLWGNVFPTISGNFLGATSAVASHPVPQSLQEELGSGISLNPYKAAADSSETPFTVPSLGCTTSLLSASHMVRNRAEAGWLRDIITGGTGTVLNHHPKEKQPPSLCSCFSRSAGLHSLRCPRSR